MFSVAVLALALTYLSCSAVGDHLAGHWVGTHVTLDISKSGENYIIKAKNPDGLFNGTFAGQYKEGKINLGSLIGDLVYSREKDEIFLAGDELKRVVEK